MKNNYLIVLLLILFCSCQSEKYPIETSQINWEKGDQIKLKLILSQARSVNDKVEEEYYIKNHFELKVLEVNDSSLVLNFDEENPMLVNIAAKFNSVISDQFTHQKIERKIVIDKASKEFNCMNAEEYSEILQQTYEELKASNDLIPDSSKSAFLDEIQTQLNGFDANSSEVLDLLLMRYRYSFKIDEPTETRDSSANPFNLDKFPGAQILSYSTNGNREDDLNLHVETSYDFEAYKKLFLGTVSGLTNLTSGLMPDDEAAENDIGGMMNQMMAQLMAQIDFDASNEVVITVNKYKKWPTEILALNNLSIKQGGKIEKVSGSALIEIDQ